MKAITYSKDALKALRRIPANVSETIRAKVRQYAKNPASLANNVIQLKGYDGYFRLRIGDWRVIFNEDIVVMPSSRSRRAAAPMIEEAGMKVQIITTPNGERLAVLPEADYLAMLEAAE